MSRIFEENGIKVTKENKREIDRVIHDMVGIDYKNCSVSWKEVKKRLAEDEEGFINDLQGRLS